MTISQIPEQLQLAWTKWDVCVKLANRCMDFLSLGKDVDHAKPICSGDCLGVRRTKTVGGSHASPFHPTSFGLPLSTDFAIGPRRSAFQFADRQRVWLLSQHGNSLANTLSSARSSRSARC